MAAHQLRNLRVNRVALVDKGANLDAKTGDGASILLYKRAFSKVDLTDNDKRRMIEAAAMDTWGDPDAQVYVYVRDIKANTVYVERDGKTFGVIFAISDTGDVTFDGDGVEVVTSYEPLKSATKKSGPTLSSVHVDVPHKKKKENGMPVSNLLKRLKEIFKEEGIAVDDADVDKAGDQMASLKAQHEELGKVIDGMGDPSTLGSDHPVHALKAAHAAMGKALEPVPAEKRIDVKDPEVEKRMASFQKQIDEANARATAAEAVSKSEVAKRELDDERTVLKSFKGVSVDIEKDALMLVALKKADKPAYDRYIATMKAADEAVLKGKLFEEVGSGLSGVEADAATRLEKMTQDKIMEVKKSGEKITYEKAYSQVCDANPALVRQMRGQPAVN